jgi:GNAT superfamily N-acetyltransferase
VTFAPWIARKEAGMSIITLSPDTLQKEHICCAISDKKCAEGYAAKKQWLADEYGRGYRFSRLDERGKVFIEYGPSEHAWMPVVAPGWMVMGCFWVSGQFKGHGHGKALLATAMDEVAKQGRTGLVAVAGKKKMQFQSDGEWLLRQGFREVDALDSGFSLLALEVDGASSSECPRFAESARNGLVPNSSGVTVYYSNRCPFTDFHVNVSLKETCEKRNLTPTIVKLDSLEAAQAAPTPATIFSLFIDGRFVTTDLSACMDSRFDKIVAKAMAA